MEAGLWTLLALISAPTPLTYKMNRFLKTVSGQHLIVRVCTPARFGSSQVRNGLTEWMNEWISCGTLFPPLPHWWESQGGYPRTFLFESFPVKRNCQTKTKPQAVQPRLDLELLNVFAWKHYCTQIAFDMKNKSAGRSFRRKECLALNDD